MHVMKTFPDWTAYNHHGFGHIHLLNNCVLFLPSSPSYSLLVINGNFTDLNLYCIKGALALFVLVSFSGYVC